MQEASRVRNTFFALLVGAAVGASVVYFVAEPSSDAGAVRDRDIVDVPQIGVEEAASERARGFHSVRTIEDTLRYPTHFQRMESLYVLAGRSDSPALQNLIYEADRVVDADIRNAALNILFTRLTELDPQSALAIARVPAFADIPELERSVWRTWGRGDLDAALATAVTDSNRWRRDAAVQALYADSGFSDDERAAKIERDSGIPPSRAARNQHARALAERSPADAIAFVNGIPRGHTDRQTIMGVAQVLTRQLGERAAAFGAQLDDEQRREIFRNAHANVLVEMDPELALERLIGASRTPEETDQLRAAARALAAQDMDRLFGYFEHARRQSERMMIGSTIVHELAQTDPRRAMEWAKANTTHENSRFLSEALRIVAADDPELAFSVFEGLRGRDLRGQVLYSVMGAIARKDRVLALRYIDTLQNRQEKTWAIASVVGNWAREEPEAAIEWAMSSGEARSRGALHNLAFSLTRTDVDTVMRMLPKVDGEAARVWRREVTRTLMSQRSIDEARRFASRFEGESDFNELQAMIVGHLARTDVDQAVVAAAQLEEGPARDQAYIQLLSMEVIETTDQVDRILGAIGSDESRRHAIQHLVGNWAYSNVEGLEQWVDRLPRGEVRNEAIATAASAWTETTPSRNQLIESIPDLKQRSAARRNQLNAVARLDWRKAEVLLATASLSEEDREAVRKAIDQYRSGTH